MKTNIGTYELWVDYNSVYSGSLDKCLALQKLYSIELSSAKFCIYKLTAELVTI